MRNANLIVCFKVNFTIPLTTPPGSYLLRFEQFPFDPYLQFYVNCAHIKYVPNAFVLAELNMCIVSLGPAAVSLISLRHAHSSELTVPKIKG